MEGSWSEWHAALTPAPARPVPARSFAECLPPLLSKAALDPVSGLLAAHAGAGDSGHSGDEGGEEGGGHGGAQGSGAGSDAFPTNVGALVDMSGKKWAHTVGAAAARPALLGGLP